MARKLKTYQTSLGCFDQAITASLKGGLTPLREVSLAQSAPFRHSPQSSATPRRRSLRLP
jgi:hypothetical protein